MSRLKLAIVLFLLLLPFVVYLAVGAWALWDHGWFVWLWLPLPICWAAALLLTRMWGKDWSWTPEVDTDPATHWSPRDEQAWELVKARMDSADDVSAENLTHLQFYVDIALELAQDITRVYHPKAADPVSSLTVPEILAALQLAFEDLNTALDDYMPGSHLLTVGHWRKLARLPELTKKFSKFYWPISAVLSPYTAVGRFAGSKAFIDPLKRDFQAGVQTWFYTLFLERLGFYAIELNSGRLAAGAERFRQAFDRDKSGNTTSPTESAAPPIQICVVGQRGAGKSSVIEAFCVGAPTETATDGNNVHETRTEIAGGERLRFLEPPGYASAELTAKERKVIEVSVRDADMLLLVMKATDPAREPDRRLVAMLGEWFASRPDLRAAPMLGVLTHIDLLKPVREWEPPYDWRNGDESKAESIREAVEFNRSLLPGLEQIVPACVSTGEEEDAVTFGVEEFLKPAMLEQLGEAATNAATKDLHKNIKQGRGKRVARQLWQAGKLLLKAGRQRKLDTRPPSQRED